MVRDGFNRNTIAAGLFPGNGTIVNAGGPPDLEKIKAVMARLGLVPALPQK